MAYFVFIPFLERGDSRKRRYHWSGYFYRNVFPSLHRVFTRLSIFSFMTTWNYARWTFSSVTLSLCLLLSPRLDRRRGHCCYLPPAETTAHLSGENTRSDPSPSRRHNPVPSGRSRWQSLGDHQWLQASDVAARMGRDLFSGQELSRVLHVAEDHSISDEQTRAILGREEQHARASVDSVRAIQRQELHR